ncbi:MAG: hypothetical protein A2Y07_07700 [Planctomycetes bacterium GWF2_50_10]|nr:MAG: hypothetical protein A2Y07_07700 [Planctomycetes bacterium GWF2_50_10]
MAKKGEKLKWNTPKGTSLNQLRKSISGEVDARGRKASETVRPEEKAAQSTRALSRRRRARAKPR